MRAAAIPRSNPLEESVLPADPDDFGICIVTADGQVFEAGDCDRPFTIQSRSKLFTFGMAIEGYGHEESRPPRRRRT